MTAPDAEAKAREAVLREVYVGNASPERAKVLADEHKAALDALIRAVEARVRGECAGKVREHTEMMSPYNREWVEKLLAALEAP